MKKKLTLSIDKKIVQLAKEYAKTKKTSVSILVSNYLRTLNSGVKITPNNELSPRLKNYQMHLKCLKTLEAAYFM